MIATVSLYGTKLVSMRGIYPLVVNHGHRRRGLTAFGLGLKPDIRPYIPERRR